MRPNGAILSGSPMKRVEFDATDADPQYGACGQLPEHQIPVELDYLAKAIEETRIVAKMLLERLSPVMLNLPRAGANAACEKETLAPMAEQIRHHRDSLREATELLHTILSTLQV